MLHSDKAKAERAVSLGKKMPAPPPRCSYLQKGAIPEAAPDMQHSGAVKAVERAAEHHTAGSAPGTVLGTRTGRALSHLAPAH